MARKPLQDTLGATLAREADAARPAFSSLTHERTMARIRSARRTAVQPPHAGWPWRITSIAATLFCIAGVAAWWQWQPRPAAIGPTTATHLAVLPDAVLPDLSRFVESASAPAREQLAAASGLDQDAARAARFLLHSIDVSATFPRNATTQRSGT